MIIDEAHRSVYQKYRAIFDYFDSLLVGLTATPKDEIDRNTYTLFDLESGVPTDAYDLDEAVDDGFLVPAKAVSVPLKFQREGIKYADLSEEEKEQWDAVEWAEDGSTPDFIDADPKLVRFPRRELPTRFVLGEAVFGHVGGLPDVKGGASAHACVVQARESSMRKCWWMPLPFGTRKSLLVIVLALASTAQGTSRDPEEITILQVTVADPHLCELHQGIAVDLSLARATELPWAHSWVAPSNRQSLEILLDGERYEVEPELIDAVRQQNRRPTSLRDVKLPVCQSIDQTGERQQRVVTLSRPGISRDRTTAIVAVTLRWRANGYAAGYTVHLRRDVDVWRIDGRSLEWVE